MPVPYPNIKPPDKTSGMDNNILCDMIIMAADTIPMPNNIIEFLT